MQEKKQTISGAKESPTQQVLYSAVFIFNARTATVTVEFVVCPQGRLSQCGHFADKREGSIFRDFMRTSFMNGTANDWLFLQAIQNLLVLNFIEFER